GGQSVTLTGTVVAVADASLSATGLTITVPQGTATGTVNVATFTDAGGVEPITDYSATINWGDGTATSPGTITVSGGVFTVAGVHTYPFPGRFSVTVTVQDMGGSTVTTAATPAVIGSTNERFVAQVYRDLLHREVDAF